MNNRKIIITEEAENDISNIEKYIAQDNLYAAKEFVCSKRICGQTKEFFY